MFDSIALQLIKAMGYSGKTPGAIAAEDVSLGLQRLEQELAALDARQLDRPPDDAQINEDQKRPITMTHRALPLIRMLKSAAKEADYIMWE